MSIKVAYYSDALTAGKPYGLGRYASELFRELQAFRPEIQARPVSAHIGLNRADLSAMQRDYGHVSLRHGRKVAASVWAALPVPTLEYWTPWADVVHCVELDYPVATRKPLVVTIHDIGPLTRPEYFRSAHPWLLKLALKSVISRAAALVCVSQATADEVQNYAGRSLGDRLSVIPEGVSDEFFEPIGEECFEATAAFIGRGEPYFLWAGSLNPRKNLDRVVAAFESVAGTIPHHLVLAGGLGWDAKTALQRIARSPVASRIHLPGRVSDRELRGLYQRASAFVYVSLMEGFGLPILEAMAGGCPVITSNISSMPEVAGGAARLCNPFEAEDIADAMRWIAEKPDAAAALASAGLRRAREFRWSTCAAKMAAVYEQVAASSPARTRACA